MISYNFIVSLLILCLIKDNVNVNIIYFLYIFLITGTPIIGSRDEKKGRIQSDKNDGCNPGLLFP